MKGSEIREGGVYLVKVSGKVQKVVVRHAFRRLGTNGIGARTQWSCENLATGRTVTVRSAQRFRGPAAEEASGHVIP